MSIKVINQVLQTTDYNLFKKLEGNRAVNNAHVKRLLDSFRKAKLQCPIIVNQHYEIIDGQHRFESSKKLGLPIDFIVCNDYGLKEVQMLNSNMANWKREDYLNAFCDLGEPEYLKFRQFMDTYPEFGIASADAILTGNLSSGHKNTTSKEARSENNTRGHLTVRYFENGDLFIPNYELSQINADKILQIKSYYDGFNRAVFVRAMLGVFRNENYDHEKFIRKLKSQPNALYHCQNVSQYKQVIEDIFNYRSINKVSLKF